MFDNFFFENHAVCGIIWKNIIEWGRPQMTIWRMRVACWIPKATNTHSIFNTYCASTAAMVARREPQCCVACLVYTTRMYDIAPHLESM